MASSMQWLGDTEAKPAPAPLRRVQALINTIDRESGDDRLADVADAEPWMLANDLLTPGTSTTAAEIALVIDVREALRALVMQNTVGSTAGMPETAPLHTVARAATLELNLDADGLFTVTPRGDAVADRLAALLLIVEAAQRDGTWSHLKACGNDECQWAFYDRSRNHGGTWCDMSSCGNKLKNREFRARQRTGR